MKIMFVCTGNICRSAMAHGLMEKKVKDLELKDIEITSCGTFAQDGEQATEEAIEAAKEYDVDLTSHRATNIRKSKIEEKDLILCATTSHKQAILQIYPHLQKKVYTMKEYASENVNNQDINIQDPWGYNIETYRYCIAQIDQCLEKIIQKIS